MAAHEVPTHILDADDVHRSWKQTLNTVVRRGERIVVEEQGAPVAAIVSVQDLARLAQFDAQRAERFTVLDRIGAAFAVAEARKQAPQRERANEHHE
jgi:antitoxin (DNA-binding transcriptional repressor) of toxin-antitoxin stability system